MNIQRPNMRSTRCPVCQEEQYADEVAFNHHVNSHFANEGANSPGPSRTNRSPSSRAVEDRRRYVCDRVMVAYHSRADVAAATGPSGIAIHE